MRHFCDYIKYCELGTAGQDILFTMESNYIGTEATVRP